jgi:hypothetical protein
MNAIQLFGDPKTVSEYAEKGDCDKRYATGMARIPFAVGLGV